jgi:hypothetical protein
MPRDPRGDTLLVFIPGFGDTVRMAPRLDGGLLRGTARQGTQIGMVALRRVAELPLDVLEPRVGDYRLDDATLFSVGGGEHAFDGLTDIHFGTGRTGALYAVDSTRFVAGPRRDDADPVGSTVQFEPGAPGVARRSEDRVVGGVGTRQFDATRYGQTRSHHSQGGEPVCGISPGPRCSTSV